MSKQKLSVKNTKIFNYQYLENLEKNLEKGGMSNIQKVGLARRVYAAILAVRAGAKSDSFKRLTEDFTELKALEYIIELFLRHESEALNYSVFDYTSGTVIDIIRNHGNGLCEALVDIVKKELPTFAFPEVKNFDDIADKELLEDGLEALENLLIFRLMHNAELEPRLTVTCSGIADYVAYLCDYIKSIAIKNKFTDITQAEKFLALVRHNCDEIINVFGSVRTEFLLVSIQIFIFSEKHKNTYETMPQDTTHNENCSCEEHAATHEQPNVQNNPFLTLE